jgi:hypothetical protein
MELVPDFINTVAYLPAQYMTGKMPVPPKP